MNDVKSGLGADDKVEMIPMSEVYADHEFNCRGPIRPIDVVDLVKDIERQGLIMPVTVCPLPPNHPKVAEGFKYKLLAGYRRHTAHRVMESKFIKCLIKSHHMSDADQRFMNLAENLQRKDLSILQEARAIKVLHDMDIPETVVAERTGMSRGWVQIRYMLLRLPENIQSEIDVGLVAQTEIRRLYTIHKTGNQDALNSAFKKMKDAKSRGASAKVSEALSDNKEDVFNRKNKIIDKTIIFAMMSHMQRATGNGLHTRVLAWVAGEISVSDLVDSIESHVEELKNYKDIPDYHKMTADEWQSILRGE